MSASVSFRNVFLKIQRPDQENEVSGISLPVRVHRYLTGAVHLMFRFLVSLLHSVVCCRSVIWIMGWENGLCQYFMQ